MHLSKTSWIVISGLVWFIVGIGLLTLGLNFIVFKAQVDLADTTSLIAKLSPLTGGREQAALADRNRIDHRFYQGTLRSCENSPPCRRKDHVAPAAD